MKRHGIRPVQQQGRNLKVSLAAGFPGRLAHKNPLRRIGFGKGRDFHFLGLIVIRKVDCYRIPERDAHDGRQLPADDQILFRHGKNLLISREADDGLVVLHYSKEACPGSVAAVE